MINPVEFGFIKSTDKYLFIRDNKVIAKLYHWDYIQGLPYEYEIKKINHDIYGGTTEITLFLGKIPSNDFATELFKNLNLVTI